MTNGTAINIQGLVKHFPMGGSRVEALKGITLGIAEGEFAGLVGPSGSGKTTLLNIIGGLDSPTEGSVEVLGEALAGKSHKELAAMRRDKIGFIFQTFNLLPVYTVFENVEFPLLLLGMGTADRKKAVDEALGWVGISDKTQAKPAMLSGGESQRVAIARAIVKRPSLILADEPTANLDARNSHNIMGILVKLNQEMSTSFLFSTHDEKVMAYLRRTIHLVDGRVDSDRETTPSPPEGQYGAAN